MTWAVTVTELSSFWLSQACSFNMLIKTRNMAPGRLGIGGHDGEVPLGWLMQGQV
jgi:hypothetical protein